MPLFDHFDILAPLYDKVIRIKDPVKIVELGGFPVEGVVLDAGGGTGRTSQALVGKAKHFVVLDLSFGMLKKAASKDGLATVNSHTEALPFPEGIFDAVIMVDALHHVCDQAETALELLRVVKPGGRIVIEEPDIGKLPVKIVALLEKLALMRSRFLSPVKITQLYKDQPVFTRIERDSFNAWVVVEKIPGFTLRE
jgi:ubiquinone/menaquinone biosynthesis C-methylase UbiE